MNKNWDRPGQDDDAAFGYWLSGFVDGEGCFRIHTEKNGTYFACHFSIKLRRDDKKILETIRSYLEVGRVQDVKASGTSKPASLFVVNTRDGCVRVRDVFRKYGLRAKKNIEFDLWSEALTAWIERKPGNRWSGPGDNSKLESLWQRMKGLREYKDPPWSGNAYQDFTRQWASEALRVLKPGGYMLVFGGPRTYHRLAAGIEDSGFEIRDSLHWIYGSGFPKSLDVSKAIDEAAGAKREVVGTDVRYNEPSGIVNAGRGPETRTLIEREISLPATDAAKQWEGWGTALKPAHEPIVLARKPFEGMVAVNVKRYGTGGLNIEGTRRGYIDEEDKAAALSGDAFKRKDFSDKGWSRPWMNDPEKVAAINAAAKERAQSGRWPANVLLSPEAAEELDKQTGKSKSRIGEPRSGKHGSGWGMSATGSEYDDFGGASRFFPVFKYEPKASREERDLGLRSLPVRTSGELTGRKDGSDGLKSPRAGAGRTGLGGGRNTHPTVKPIDLMRWLVRLVTPPDGLVLDPFMGSGSTGAAAVLEAMNFAGIEEDPESFKIAELRIKYWKKIEVQKDLF